MQTFTLRQCFLADNLIEFVCFDVVFVIKLISSDNNNNQGDIIVYTQCCLKTHHFMYTDTCSSVCGFYWYDWIAKWNQTLW